MLSRLKDERGSVEIIEAGLVFPILIFSILILLSLNIYSLNKIRGDELTYAYLLEDENYGEARIFEKRSKDKLTLVKLDQVKVRQVLELLDDLIKEEGLLGGSDDLSSLIRQKKDLLRGLGK